MQRHSSMLWYTSWMRRKTASANLVKVAMSVRDAISTQLCMANIGTPQSKVIRSLSAYANLLMVAPPSL